MGWFSDGWLDDLAQKRTDDEKESAENIARRDREQREQHEAVDSMVMGLLRELGRAYWGRGSYVYRTEVIHGEWGWIVKDVSDYFGVSLSFSGECFKVSNSGESIETVDLSEGSLKDALRAAFAAGPVLGANR